MKTLTIIGAATTLAILAFAATAKIATYHTAPVFLIPLTWLPVFLRRKLNLHPVDYALFCLAILAHMSGARGYYQKSPLPFSFDIAVHFYFALAATFLLHRAIAFHFPLKRWQINVTVFLFMMGLAAMHEIYEYGSYLVLGEETGMLKPHTSYVFDTARDLTNNFLGTLLALIVISVARLIRDR